MGEKFGVILNKFIESVTIFMVKSCFSFLINFVSQEDYFGVYFISFFKGVFDFQSRSERVEVVGEAEEESGTNFEKTPSGIKSKSLKIGRIINLKDRFELLAG